MPCREGKEEVKNNTQIYTTQEGIEQIKYKPRVYTSQEGLEEIISEWVNFLRNSGTAAGGV